MKVMCLRIFATVSTLAVLNTASAAEVCDATETGCDDVGLLQIKPSAKAEEAILDFNLGDVGAVDGESVAEESDSGIDQTKWSAMFHKLDTDGDGKVSAADLDKDSFAEASADVKQMNITKGQLTDALALMAQLDPKLAPFLIKHHQLAVFTAWTGQKPPPGSPEPTADELTPIEEDDGRRMLSLSPCEIAIVGTLFPATNLILAAFAIRLPGGKVAKAVLKYAKRSRKFLKAVNRIVSNLGGPDKITGGGPPTLAKFLLDLFKEMWNSGVLKNAIKEVGRSLSFWDYIAIGAPALASLAAFALSAGTANFVIAIVGGAVAVGELTVALVDVGKRC